ncbi:Ser/Thr protein phosphatase family protein-like protein [Xylogone sp. PMI_703]|nr:Ser/Thr protein phosphatase family protein-like protein [Xylogone sp. PMI_703]
MPDSDHHAPTGPELETPPATAGNGLNAHPGFTGVTQLLDLPAKHLPQIGKHRSPGRLVIVGDVHGMRKSLEELLAKINFNEKEDHLIFTGDMISKGPDSAGVVDLAMKVGASSVRGNHEDRVLLVHTDMETKHLDLPVPGPHEDEETSQDSLEEESFNRGDYKDRKLVKALGEKRLKWLRKLPVILRVGELGEMGQVVVVHGGLVPGVELMGQDAAIVMNMRSIGHDGVASESRKGPGWWKAWNKYQKTLPKNERSTVIYGHDSKRGLQIEKYSMGIDSGCQNGGKLTAVVIEGGHSAHKFDIVQVDCQEAKN